MANDILDHRVLTGVVRNLDEDQELLGLEEVAGESIESPTNTFKWDEIQVSRDLATFSAPDAEAGMVDQEEVIERHGATASIREKKSLKGKTMAWLREPGTEHQQRGERAVRREMEDLNGRVDRRVEWMIWQALQNSISYSTEDYELQVTFNIPSDHQTNPSSLSNGGVQWTSHSSATPIADLLEMQETVEGNPDKAYMSRKVMRNLIQVQAVQDALGEGTLKEQVAREGQILTLAGIDLEVYDAQYTDDSGNTGQRFVGIDRITLLDTSKDVIVPVEAPAIDPKANFGPGKFSKTWEDEDPPATNALIEYQVLPIVQLPNYVYNCKVL